MKSNSDAESVVRKIRRKTWKKYSTEENIRNVLVYIKLLHFPFFTSLNQKITQKLHG